MRTELGSLIHETGARHDRGMMLSVLASALFCRRHRRRIRSPQGIPLFKDWRSQVHLHPEATLEIDGRLFVGWGASRIGSIWQAKHDRAIVQVARGGRLIVRGRVELRPGVRLVVGPGATVEIGDRTYINGESLVLAQQEIRIGAGCNISWRVQILDTDFHALVHQAEGGEVRSRPESQPVIIRDHVWIGASAIVCQGVTIGQDAVVAAGSLVFNKVKPGCLVGGVPAVTLKQGIDWR